MDNLDPFKVDFDYRYAYPVVNPPSNEEMIDIKLEAIELLREQYPHLDNSRLAPATQLLSMIRIELPRVFRDVCYWDVESSYCQSQHIFDLAVKHVAGFYLSIMNECCPIIQRNHLLFIFSTPALNLFCNMLTNPLEEICNLIQDGEMDQITQIQTVEAAYVEVFREVGPGFPYPIYANAGLRDLVEPQVEAYMKNLEENKS